MTRQPSQNDQPPAADVPEADAKLATPGLGALFNPAAMAKARAATQPFVHKGNKRHQDLTPGPAPHGTRKAMGKR